MKEQIATHTYGVKRKDETIYITDEDAASQSVKQHRQPRPGDTICIDDETFYNERSRSSVIRRGTIPPTPAHTRTVMRVTHHDTPVTPRASLKAQQPQQQVKQKPVKQAQKHFHWLFYVGCGAMASLALWTIGSTALSWLQNEHDNLTYGTPRTYQCDAAVGHQGESHFTAENLDGHIIIFETQINNLASSKVYSGPVFSGPGADDYVATLSFKDVNGDGKPDLVVTANNQLFVLINTGSSFRPSVPSDHINGV